MTELLLRLTAMGMALSAASPVPVKNADREGRDSNFQLRLSLSPEAPIKGRDEFATLTVRLFEPDGAPVSTSSSLTVRSSAGEVGPLESVGPGQFRARFNLPKTRHPEVIALIAFLPGTSSTAEAAGCLRVSLSSAITFPGKSEPFAQTTLEIAGQQFGPVAADAQGRFEVPVVVPPGVRQARGVAIDRVGNRRVSPVDLRLPPEKLVACTVIPSKLWADGKSQASILCAGSDPTGRPLSQVTPRLHAKMGRVEPSQALGNGFWKWTYTSTKVPGTEFLEAVLPRGGAPANVEVTLVQSPAVSVELMAEEALVHRGGSRTLTARILDASGKPRPNARVSASSSAGTLTVQEVNPGVYAIRLAAPLEAPAQADIFVRAWGPPEEGLPAPKEVSANLRVQVAPALPVNVRIEAGPQEVRFWAEDPDGHLLPGRAMHLSVDGGEPPFEKTVDGRYLARLDRPFHSASASDVETGVTAVARGSR